MTWEQRDAFLAAADGERRYATLFELLVKGGLVLARRSRCSPAMWTSVKT